MVDLDKMYEISKKGFFFSGVLLFLIFLVSPRGIPCLIKWLSVVWNATITNQPAVPEFFCPPMPPLFTLLLVIFWSLMVFFGTLLILFLLNFI